MRPGQLAQHGGTVSSLRPSAVVASCGRQWRTQHAAPPVISPLPVNSEFLKPRLVGSRFEDHSIPVEVLKDWAAFEGLIVEAARWLYLEENPRRKRTPRGFAQSFALHLSQVEEGSAVMVLELPHAPGTLVPDAFAHWFEKARDRVLQTIEAVSQGRPLDDLLPKSLLAYFDQFGRSLRDDEQVEFTLNATQAKVIYDHRVRKTLVLKSATEYRTEESVRGAMSELNLENRTFTLKLIGGEKVIGHFSEELRNAAHGALGAYGESLVMVEGAVVRDPSDNRKRIEQVTRIEALDPLDVPARLEALSLLRDGWMDGEGVKPPAAGLAWLEKAWAEHWPEDVPLPYVYPTVFGGLQLEWSFPTCVVSVEADIKQHAAQLLASRTLDGEILEELPIDLVNSEGWQRLAEAIRRFGITE